MRDQKPDKIGGTAAVNFNRDPRLSYSIREIVSNNPVGRTAVYEALNRGDLKARKMGRRTVILRTDLEQWLASLPFYCPRHKHDATH